ncbi:Relaxase/Mobilisation nuclease domain-containing protein [Salinimicrobium catena]|uniref:Relaxase/Mobilisation nuclease domain-containing protein n=1 Tax=Salinimicrobium catena TaxID=390640 RepID=A0A1H5JVI9_9FLAO|nr:relaxase/mobilization nuclease domain-containing protein [Salinimicrobium catena]SDK90192.1 Relaxase/Mobilisation nuclease domain-containing protein [Salinimicrobium catena]SEE55738.1 Relaxase/Mobilisation nuclease domain-containing protein [Salinimicrobium catena]
MIGKGKSISHTLASMNYGWNQEKQAEVIFKEHLAGDTPGEITEEFRIIQSQNERCKNNTLSFVLSPTIKDGQDLSGKKLYEITSRFIKEMNLQNHQSIGFVHRDKQHLHIHLYTNRIALNGELYKDSFIGKRSQAAADKVAQQMKMSRAREVQQEKLAQLKHLRKEVQHIHEKVLQTKPKSLDEYMKKMKEQQVKVLPSINKANQLQGFRFEYKGFNLKGSQIHRSMSSNKIILALSQNNKYTRLKEAPQNIKVLDHTVQLSTGIINKIAKDIIKQTIRRALDTGMGAGF